jgi:hypothetical protein
MNEAIVYAAARQALKVLLMAFVFGVVIGGIGAATYFLLFV